MAGSSTFTYSYQGLNILYEKNVTGGTTTVTKHFYAGGLQVAKMVGTGMYYLHQDALGSTRLVMTSTVSVKFSSNYVPYGVNYAASGKEVFMYTGKPQDSATGLYYYGARFYDPSIGRFVSQDSFTGAQEDPMSLNRYIYCRDNPMRLVDSNGNVWIPPQVAQTMPSNDWLGTTISNWWNSMPPNEQHAIVVTGIISAAAVVTIATLGVGSVVAAPMAGAALTSCAYTVTAGPKATPIGAGLSGIVGGLTAGITTIAVPAVQASTLGSPIIGPILTRSIPVLTGVLSSVATAAVTHQAPTLNPYTITFDALTGPSTGYSGLLSSAIGQWIGATTTPVPFTTTQSVTTSYSGGGGGGMGHNYNY